MIKFYAKTNQLVRIPGAQPRPNQPDMYVGREFDSKTRGYPAIQTGYEVDENSDAGRRLIRLTRIDNSLFPADKQTADMCNVEFVPVEFNSGTFVVKSSKTKQSPPTES